MGAAAGSGGSAGRENTFDLLRLAAAGLVLISHSYVLTGGTDPFVPLLNNQIASIGVFMFFGLSGFLITASWFADPRPRVYAAKRALRIVPALVVAAALSAFVLGPLVTSLALGTYLGDPQPYAYVLKSVLLITFNPHLPGVFESTPYPDVVNGSLWTIPLEATCYLLVLVAGVLGALRRPRVLAVVFVLALAALAAGAPPDSATGDAPTGIDLILNAVRVGTAFLCGVLVYHHRDRIPDRPWSATLTMVVAVILPLPDGLHSAVVVTVVPVWVYVVGRRPPGPLARRLMAPGDISYGTYIYAFPIQQLLARQIDGLSPAGMLLLSAPLACLAGYASWRLVESPALRLKRRFAGAQPAQPAAATDRPRLTDPPVAAEHPLA